MGMYVYDDAGNVVDYVLDASDSGDEYGYSGSLLQSVSDITGTDWTDWSSNGSFWDSLGNAATSLVNKFGSGIKDLIYKPSGDLNIAGLATLAGGAYKLFGGGDNINTGGYSKPVPNMTAVREAVQYDDTNRRPGSGGRRYFSDTTYVPEGGDVAAARSAAQEQAQGLAAAVPQQAAPAPVQSIIPTSWNTPANFNQPAPPPAAPAERGAMAPIDPETGGLVGLAKGGQVPQFRGQLENKGFVIPGDVVAHADPMGQANKERGLRALHQNVGVEAIRGPGDAMSDSIPTNIDGKEPARVANGEAYVPRQNVARLGGGDVDQGANRLHDIMNSLRKQRTGSTQQINPDNPQELRAAYGGQIQGLASGGHVKSYAGTTDGSQVTTTPATGSTTTSYGNSTGSTLSPWVGDYVTNFLGQAQAAANQPYQAYTGPLTAGPSQLQQQAFAGAQGIAQAGYTPTQFTGGLFDTQAAQQYMNPYLQAALDPQMQEMKRQADIARLEDASRLTKAGAYGGTRQAVMEAEGRRNLLNKQSQALGQGYATAYDKAMAQFNADQGRQMDAQKATEASRQYGADFARQSLADLANLGATQRDIEQQGLTADKVQFEEERGWQYQMPQYLKDLLGANLPVSTVSTTPNTTGYGMLNQGIADLTGLYKTLSNLGQTQTATPTTPATTTPTTTG